MLLTTVNPSSTLSGYQIQKNLQKISFAIAAAKAAATPAVDQILTDAAQIFVTLKRQSSRLGQKDILPRSPLSELLQVSQGIQGALVTSGTDAAVAYTAEAAIEISLAGNIDLVNGDYLELSVENPVAGLTITVSGVFSTVKDQNHLKWERVSLAANEAKRVSIENAALVALPVALSEARIVGHDSITCTSNTLQKFIYELQGRIINVSNGTEKYGTFAVLPARHIKFIDLTNGVAATNIYILTQKSY